MYMKLVCDKIVLIIHSTVNSLCVTLQAVLVGEGGTGKTTFIEQFTNKSENYTGMYVAGSCTFLRL